MKLLDRTKATMVHQQSPPPCHFQNCTQFFFIFHLHKNSSWRTCTLMLHFNANLHSLAFCPSCNSALFMLPLSSGCPTIKLSRHKQQTPCHNTNIILLFTSTASTIGSAASDSSEEEEEQPILKYPPPYLVVYIKYNFTLNPSDISYSDDVRRGDVGRGPLYDVSAIG